MSKIKLIQGDNFYDERGVLSFINQFNEQIKRFYLIENFKKEYIRAWHGHKNEKKIMYCVDGVFKICLVKIDNFSKPSKDLEIEKYILSAAKPSILIIPGGYANGLQNLKSNSKLLIFSNKSLEESKNDDYRYQFDFWNPWEPSFY